MLRMWADAESPMFFRIEVDFLFALKHTQVVEYLNPWQENVKVNVGVQDVYAYLAHLIRNTSDLGKNPFLFPDGDSVDPTTTIEEFIVFDKNADRLHPKHWSLVESRSVYVRRSDAKTSEGPKLRPGAHLPELEPRKKPKKYKKWYIKGATLVSPILKIEELERAHSVLRHVQRVLVNYGEESHLQIRPDTSGLEHSHHDSKPSRTCGGWTNTTCGLRVLVGFRCCDRSSNDCICDTLNTNLCCEDLPTECSCVDKVKDQSIRMLLSPIQNLLVFWTSFEESIESCSQENIPHKDDLQSSLLQSYQNDTSNHAVDEDEIYSCRRFGDLRAHMKDRSRIGLGHTKIEFDTMDPESDNMEGQAYKFLYDKFKRLEFVRQAGSLDADHIRWWALFVTSMVKFSQKLSDERLMVSIVGKKLAKDSSARDSIIRAEFDLLLDILDFPEEGRAFYKGQASGEVIMK